MSDIVERLRSVYAAGPAVGSFIDPVPDPLTNEAAAEIERLRELLREIGDIGWLQAPHPLTKRVREALGE